MTAATPSLHDLAPAIPRSTYTTWTPTAADRLDWHRRETTLYATATHHHVPRTTAEHILRGLMDTAEWQLRAWTLDDLFATAHGILLNLVAAHDPIVTLTPHTADRPRIPQMRPAAPPQPRPMATAWTRWTTTHPELRPRHA